MAGEVARVGIFMPAYNQGAYIDETLESLKAQTFQDFIVHIVDDGSTDGVTADKLESIEYSKATVYKNKKNKGVAARAREHYKILETEYIMVLCADDIIDKTFLEKTVRFLDENGDYGAVAVNIKHFGENDLSVKFDEEKATLPGILLQNAFFGSSLMRKKALDMIDLSGSVRYQDWERWIGMLAHDWKLGVIDETLFHYRIHKSSLSASASVADELAVREHLFDKYKELYLKYAKELHLLREEEYLRSISVSKAKDILDDKYKNLEQENKLLKSQLQAARGGKKSAINLLKALAKTPKKIAKLLRQFLRRNK